ncbi:RNA-binding S4 domain-containing protein [Tyzzerella sp. OttesenSCG-928-J15]|nr:RNA-binding S4 domain-containing protein [Tyzzerella sp. OttesenSCG-928-J15]MDL2248442.1 RNA-binding S4 domain-containing protein [Tyzzerella sp. OttesenSCG-928-J15]
MVEKSVKIKTEYIKLADLLKYASVVNSGSDAKYLILEGKVKLNGEIALQRGRKIYPGMVVECEYDDNYKIIVE